MDPPQDHQRPSRREKFKSFIHSVFPSNSRASSAARDSRAHDASAGSSRPTSVSPANVSPRTDLVSGNDTASTPKSAPDHATPSGVLAPMLASSRSRTVQATGNITLHAPTRIADPIRLEHAATSDMAPSRVTGPLAPAGLAADIDYNHKPYLTASSTAPFTPARLAPPLSTAHPPHDYGQNSTTERSFLLAWHGVEQLLKKIEGCLDGTPFKGPVSVLNTLIAIGEAVVDNKSAMKERMVQTLDRLNVVNGALLKAESDGARLTMLNFAKKLADEAVILDGISSGNIWEKILENEEDAKKIEESFKRMDEHTKNFHLEIVLSIERNMSGLSDALTRLQLDSWPRSRRAPYNADIGDSSMLTRELCTPGTRVVILERIYKWAQDSSPKSPRIFWLTGDAGSGKSTIACTVADHFDDESKSEAQNILRANFFCSRQFEETRRQKNIIPTIVYQLARQSRSYAHALLEANKFDSVDVLSKQMKDLLVGPWQQSTSDRPPELPPYLVVVDALDEIEGQGGSAFLRDLLTTVDRDRLQRLKFLITSRPDPELASLCKTFSSDAVCHLYDVPTDTVDADIVAYFKDKLPKLRDEPRLTHLAQKADGLFIYAATVVRYISPRPKMAKDEQLDLMCKFLDCAWPMSTSAHTIASESLVDKLYQQILWGAFSDLDDERFRARLSILHTFLCTEERVSPSIVATFLSDMGMEEKARIVVDDLHAVLYIKDSCVFWYHASFPDFIFTQTRSKFTVNITPSSTLDVDMSCDVAAHNAVLVRRCFSIMMSDLRFNICNLPSSFLLDSEVPELSRLIQENISDVLTYCSRYWAQHLARAALNDRDDLRTCIKAFFPMHILFWIETMNLLGSSPRCTSMLQRACEWVLKGDGSPSDLTQDIAEAANFATYFTASPAALSTAQMYVSSLATWSQNSTMSQIWKNQFSHAFFTQIEWGNTVPPMTLRTSGSVSSVASSSDGTRIISGSYDTSVRVWDASTGMELKVLNGHTDSVSSVAFSSDGTHIVSGSNDHSVRMWDASTGMVLKVLNGHTDSVLSVAFSSDGTHIVSGSIDKSVRMWDASTGMELKVLNGHTDSVSSVAFSSDGTHIVSGSIDHSMRMWDASTGVVLKVLNGHTDSVLSVAFSSDGTCIVSGSIDNSVRMWDASTGVELKVLNGHTDSVSSVAFSSDGTCIVSGSIDKSVRVWDASTVTALISSLAHTTLLCGCGMPREARS